MKPITTFCQRLGERHHLPHGRCYHPTCSADCKFNKEQPMEQREMTLKEWCQKLPEWHLANRQIAQVKQTLALLNSMVEGGEAHSPESRKMVADAADSLS